MPECEFQLYKLLSVKCYAITKITLSVLFAFCIQAEFISSSPYFVSVLSVPWNSAQRQTDIRTHAKAHYGSFVHSKAKEQSKLFQKHLLNFLASTDSKKTISIQKNCKKRKEEKVKWICWTWKALQQKHTYVMSADSSTVAMVESRGYSCVWALEDE